MSYLKSAFAVSLITASLVFCIDSNLGASGRIYWTDSGTKKIQRANLDGSNLEDLVSGLGAPIGLAVDTANGKIYWIDNGTKKIQRANLDGSNIQDLVVTGLPGPQAIALDVVGGKMYWTDAAADKIQRANVDGSNPENLVISGLEGPQGIALDVTAGKMYWADGSKIQRANLDGTNIENLITGLGFPIGLSLDLLANKIYWIDAVLQRIRRANLNGTSVESLVSSDLIGPQYIVVGGGKMYWTDLITDRIQRANLDGSGIESIVTGLSNPTGVALDSPNAPPTANAGQDRTVRPGETVNLNCSASFDDNTPTELLAFAWNFISKPAGSNAALFGNTTLSPNFIADTPGTYVVQLIVTDGDGLSSSPDDVVISSNNLAPTANAGNDRLVIVADLVTFNGTGSTDPEFDPLTYSWAITSAPTGSSAILSSATNPTPTLIPDIQGTYTVGLVVSDNLGPSLPDAVVITATSAQNYAEVQIQHSNVIVTTLPLISVTTAGNQNALSNFLSQTTAAIQAGDLVAARTKLQQAIERTDGCALRGAPDGNGAGRDWIRNCADQLPTYQLLNDALDAITQ